MDTEKVASTNKRGMSLKLSTVIIIMVVEFLVLGAAAIAANSQVYGSLQRSRDALLDQRHYLQAEADRVGVRVAALQTQLDTINSYLRDNDRALRDVETAMRRAQ
jgi:hypothetical protein